jgi:hypothetical protein
VHNYPEPVSAIPRFMHDDFVPFVVDQATGAAIAVAPLASRGANVDRVRVLFAEHGHPLADQHSNAEANKAAMVLGPKNSITQAAFAKQR